MQNFEETKPEENTPVDQEPEMETLIITEDIRSYIYESAKWSKFLSIVGFVATGFMVLVAFSAGGIISTMNSMVGEANNPYAKLGAGALTVLLLLLALLYFYPSLLLFKYSSAAKKAVLFGDQPNLAVAMSKLKSFFKFWGVLAIVALGFNLLIILFAVIVNISASVAA
jgi:hypothetical protein